MRSRRVRPKRAHPAFGLTIAMYVLMPTPVGLQDIASLIARQSFVPDTMRQRLASPFGTIHAATFSLPRPIGTAIPEQPLVRLASLGTASDVVGSIGVAPYPAARDKTNIVFPTINRTGKGDRLMPASPEPAADDSPASSTEERPDQTIMPARAKTGEIEPNDHTGDELPDAQTVVSADIAREAYKRNAPAVQPDEIAAAMHFEPFPEYDISLSL